MILNTDKQMYAMLVLLLAQACMRGAFCVDNEGVLQVARTDFHAYENAWSVSFGDLPGHAFDLLTYFPRIPSGEHSLTPGTIPH